MLYYNHSKGFLSTLPARGATDIPAGSIARHFDFYPRSPRGERRISDVPILFAIHFYPRSPRGERQGKAWFLAVAVSISIHAPREGSDRTYDIYFNVNTIFLSTLPARGATRMVSGSV